MRTMRSAELRWLRNNTQISSGSRLIHSMRRLLFSITLIAFYAAAIGACEARAQSVSVDGITGPSSPMPSGQVFAVYIGYSWSGLVDEIEIQAQIPAGLEFVSAPISNQIGTSGPILTGPYAGGRRFNITQDLSQPSGVGQVELHVRFKFDSTCNGAKATFLRPASRYRVGNSWSDLRFHTPSFEVTALAQNKWSIRKDALWCRYDDSVTNSVLYRIAVINNEANNHSREGCLMLDVQSLKDQLQSGAVLESVVANPPGYPAPSWNSAIGTSGTIQFVNTSNPVTRLLTANQWYFVYYWVKYTRPPFTSGQTVQNNAALYYSLTRCEIKDEKMTDTAAIKLCEYESKGVMSKSFTMAVGYPSNPYYYPAIAPGCCGAYKLAYTNTGTVNQSSLVMTDVLPSSVDANMVRTIVPSGMTAIVEYLIGTTWTQIGNYTTSGTYNTTATIPPTATQIRWTYGGTALPIGHTLNNEIAFCFRTTDRVIGATLGPLSPPIVNNANVSQDGIVRATASNTLQWSATKPKILTNKFVLDNCVPGAYWPGSTARFRMAVGNLGSDNAINCAITDILPSGLTIVPGSTRYQWVDDISTPWITKANPACGTGSATSNQLPTGSITQSQSFSNGVQTVNWAIPTVPKDCDGNPSYLVIDFDVLIASDPAALAGQYCNQFTFTGTGATSGVAVTNTSNNACLIVSATPQGNASKTVGTMINGSFSPSASIPAGGQGYFKLRFKNTGNSPLKDINILDILPHTGTTDVSVLPPFTPRANDFALSMNNAVTTSTTASGSFAVSYDLSQNPKRSMVGSGFGVTSPNDFSGGASPTWTAPFATGRSIQIDGNTTVLQPGQYVEAIIPFTLPADAPGDSVTCNTFAYQTRPTGFGVGSNPVLLRAESPSACVTSIAADKGNCCDTAYFVPYAHPDVQISYKTVHVINLQGSAITSIDVEYRDCSSGGPGTLITDINIPQAGGGYKELRASGSPLMRSLPVLFVPTYRRIPATGNIPNWPGGANKQSEVMFNIGLNPFHPSTPDVVCIKLIIHHADGGTCEWELPAWDPSIRTGQGGGVLTGVTLPNIYAVRMNIDKDKLPRPVGFVTVTLDDTANRIIGGSGSAYVAGLEEKEAPLTWDFERTNSKAIFTVKTMSDTLDWIDLFISAADAERRPKLNIRTFDVNGDLMDQDSIVASTRISRVDPSIPTDPLGINVTSISPNPGSTIMVVSYELQHSGETRIELFDALGKSIDVLSESYLGAGSHEIPVNVGALAEGTYFVRITNSISQASAMLRVIR